MSEDNIEDPAAEGQSAVPVFPIESLPRALGAVAKAMVDQFQCGQNLPCMAVLGALNAAIGTRFVAWNPVIHKATPANIFQIAVAKSGDGKSQVMNYAFRPIQEHEDEVVTHWKNVVRPEALASKQLIEMEIAQIKSDYKAKIKKADQVRQAAKDGEASAAPDDGTPGMPSVEAILSPGAAELGEEDKGPVKARLAELNKQLAEVERKLVQPRLIVDDCTPEKMASLMAHSPYLVSATPEARKAIEVLLGRYSSKDKDQPADEVFVKAYSGDKITVDRQGAGSFDVPSPCLSVIWMVQPGMVDRMLSTAALKDSGFLQRCLFGHSEGVTGDFEQSIKVPQEVFDDYRCVLRAILRHDPSSPQVIKFSREAGRAVNQVREQRRVTWVKSHENRQMFESRYAEHVTRLAMGIHIGDYSECPTKHEISEATVRLAIAILDFFIHAHKTVFPAFEHAEARWIREEIKSLLKTYPNGFTEREAKKSPLNRVKDGVVSLIEREIAEGRLFTIKSARTERYTDDRSKAILPPPDTTGGGDQGDPF
jgi:hypothetical protein